MKKTLLLVQARLNSTRLPNKIFLEISKGVMAIDILIERLRKIKNNLELIMIIPENIINKPLENYCLNNNIKYFLGDEEDLLDRHYKAAIKFNGKKILKVPSDCIFMDPKIIDNIIDYFNKNDFDYLSNLYPESYPYGFDVEIFTINTLKKCWLFSKQKHEREHTTPYILNNKHMFKIGNYKWETGLNLSKKYRIVLDYKEDLDFLRVLYKNVPKKNNHFTLDEIVDYLNNNIKITKLNSMHINSQWYNNL